MHERLFMQGLTIADTEDGHVYDVATELDVLMVLYCKKFADETVQTATVIDINALLGQEGLEVARSSEIEKHTNTTAPASTINSTWEDETFDSSVLRPA